MLVRARMTADVLTATPETTIAEALNVTRDHGIRHLPVLDGEHVVGVVTDRDLRLAMPPMWAEQREELERALRTHRVGAVMTQTPITVAPDTPIEDAVQLMYDNRIGCLPVLENGRMVGILTETDLLHSLAELLCAGRPSSRIEIRMPNKPGELARVVRLIGIEYRLNITGLIQPPPMEADGDCSAIIHLQTLDPRPVVAALRKLGYEVGWPALGLDDLQDADWTAPAAPQMIPAGI